MKITLIVIGGGAVNWMRELMRDVYLLDELEGGEIRLVDPEREYVQAVAEMLGAFNRARNKDFGISVMEDRREALTGADFVLTTFSPGTMAPFRNDLEIPAKYGIHLPVSMTVGIPGISAALRTIPVAQEIVADMEELCPGAWLLNVTNPMSVVTRTMNLAARKTRIIGMCHEFHAFDRYMGPMLGLERPEGMDILTYLYQWLPEQDFDYTVAGINHFIWLTEARLRGENVLPRIYEFCQHHRSVEDFQQSQGRPVKKHSYFQNSGEAKFALCRQFGYLPLAGDRHLIEFYPSLCNIRNGYGLSYNVVKTTVDSRIHQRERNLSFIHDVAAARSQISWSHSGEEITKIMRAILTGRPTPAIVNAPNCGQISNLPPDVVVETLAEVSDQGIRPKMSGTLPGAIGSLARLYTDIQEMTVRAALDGDRRLLVEAMSLDPSSASANFDEIPKLTDELLKANRQWLPRFFP